MATRIRRIIAVILLIMTALLIGYSCHTGNRLAKSPDDLDGYKRYIFRAKDGTMVAFTENGALYDTVENTIIMLEFMEYTEGVITMEKQGVVYTFVAVGKDMLYDANKKQILTRRGAYG